MTTITAVLLVVKAFSKNNYNTNFSTKQISNVNDKIKNI